MTDQLDTLRQQASSALEAGCAGVLGLRRRWGQVGPHLFTSAAELADLVTEPRYQLAAYVRRFTFESPQARLAVVARGCEERTIANLVEKKQMGPADNVSFIGVACSPEQAEECGCEKPIYDTKLCTGCWKCVEQCDKKAIEVINPCPIAVRCEFNRGMARRKAIFKPFAQAVPNKFVRDPNSCLRIKKELECKGCENICQAKAIVHEDQDRIEEVEVGAIVVATGYDLMGKERAPEMAEDADVLNGLEFERIVCPSGPTAGKIVRPSDRKEPKEVVFISCVGSRDPEHGMPYCSRVCCMYSAKLAMLYKHAVHDGQAYVFYMDVRSDGKGYEEFVRRAVEEEGVVYLRSRVSRVFREGDKIMVWGADTLSGKRVEIAADMVVLAMAMVPAKDATDVAARIGIRADEFGFVNVSHPKLRAVETGVDGIFVAGTAQGPKDVPESVAQASAAASKVLGVLSQKTVKKSVGH
ncbi:MAG: FAD-dependent oxidoreductase [Planctomycetota bacterium]|nr:FAD-dependent oxidoreductase [Planctomycetota bacterium]